MMQAIKSLAYNKSLRGNHNRTSWKDYKIKNNKPLEDHIKATPELLEEIRTRLQAENKKRRKQELLFLLLSFVIIIVILYLLNTL
jgi:cytoskeletal protein RodZ